MDPLPEERIIRILKDRQVEYVATLPCEKVRCLLSLIPDHFREIPLTREADGFGICAGLVLAGHRPAMLIQNTGLGNSITDIASLFQTYRLPLPLFISWRGVYKEAIENQKNLGGKTIGLLEALGVPYTVVEHPQDLELVAAAVDRAYERQTVYAIVLSPRLWEESSLSPSLEEVRHGAEPKTRSDGLRIEMQAGPTSAEMTRYAAIELIMEHVDDQIVIGNTGIPSKELYAVKDRPLNFYMLGSLGLASSIGVGLSIGQGREVWVLDGDGSLLMNPNALLSVSMFGESNLTVFAIDNASWGSTGDQVTPTLDHVDLEVLARAYGIECTFKVHSAADLAKAIESRHDGPRLVHFIARPGSADVSNVPLSTVEMKDRFMAALSADAVRESAS